MSTGGSKDRGPDAFRVQDWSGDLTFLRALRGNVWPRRALVLEITVSGGIMRSRLI